MNQDKPEWWEENKECQLVLDHNPVWCGDCFACSKCGQIFVTAGVANVSVHQANQNTTNAERIRGLKKRTIENMLLDDPLYQKMGMDGVRGYNDGVMDAARIVEKPSALCCAIETLQPARSHNDHNVIM